MMKTFLIGGTIIADSAEAWAFEDVTPSQVRSFIKGLEDGEPLQFDISSPGGDVTAGVAIANLIRQAARDGHETTAHVVGIAASMASVVACACDKLVMDESAFLMIHNPWTVTQGNAGELRKTADVLDQMRDSILSFYRSKFEKTDDEIRAMMDEETWITGGTVADFGLKAEVIASEQPLRAAACAREIPGFAKMPDAVSSLFVLGRHDTSTAPVSPVDETSESQAAAEETPQPTEAAAQTEEVAENVSCEKSTTSEAPAQVTQADGSEPADDVEAKFTARLSAAMRSRDTEINDLKARLVDAEKKAVALLADRQKEFQDKLQAKEKELIDARAEITSLTNRLASTEKELRETASALEVKSDTLQKLNGAVNTPADVSDVFRKVNHRAVLASLPANQRGEYYKKHASEIDG